MRCTPLIVWASHISSDDKFKEILVADIQLTHPSEFVQDVQFTYAVIMRYLLRNPNNQKRAQEAIALGIQFA